MRNSTILEFGSRNVIRKQKQMIQIYLSAYVDIQLTDQLILFLFIFWGKSALIFNTKYLGLNKLPMNGFLLLLRSGCGGMAMQVQSYFEYCTVLKEIERLQLKPITNTRTEEENRVLCFYVMKLRYLLKFLPYILQHECSLFICNNKQNPRTENQPNNS